MTSPCRLVNTKRMPAYLRARSIHQAQSSLLSARLNGRKMYDLLRPDYYWPHMVTYVYDTVKNCSQSPRIGTKFKHHRQLDFFPPAGPLKFVPIDIHGSLPRTKTGHQFVVIIIERRSLLTRDIPTAKIT